MATWNMMNFQDPNSPFAMKLISFYHMTMIVMTVIVVITIYVMYLILKNSLINLNFLKDHNIEIFWTITPMFMLFYISMPSLKTLYFIDELWSPIYFTIKAIGHQWYWTYEYPEFDELNFNSYIIYSMEKLDCFRLLDVDNRLIVPFNIPMRMLTTSSDVIHSWTIPSVGIKMDATPGRINQMTLISMRPGLFFGQCSEICGAYHSFMPISMESTNLDSFIKFVMSKLE